MSRCSASGSMRRPCLAQDDAWRNSGQMPQPQPTKVSHDDARQPTEHARVCLQQPPTGLGHPSPFESDMRPAVAGGDRPIRRGTAGPPGAEELPAPRVASGVEV